VGKEQQQQQQQLSLLSQASGKRTSKFNGYGDFINLLGHVRPFILRHPNKYR
jgi:hypothetical protein